jgi:hypothetical protein
MAAVPQGSGPIKDALHRAAVNTNLAADVAVVAPSARIDFIRSMTACSVAFGHKHSGRTLCKSLGKLEAKMTPKQIDTLAGMIANSLPSLLRARPYKEGKQPNKPKNMRRLYIEPDDVKLIIRAALNQK